MIRHRSTDETMTSDFLKLKTMSKQMLMVRVAIFVSKDAPA